MNVHVAMCEHYDKKGNGGMRSEGTKLYLYYGVIGGADMNIIILWCDWGRRYEIIYAYIGVIGGAEMKL